MIGFGGKQVAEENVKKNLYNTSDTWILKDKVIHNKERGIQGRNVDKKHSEVTGMRCGRDKVCQTLPGEYLTSPRHDSYMSKFVILSVTKYITWTPPLLDNGLPTIRQWTPPTTSNGLLTTSNGLPHY